MEEWKEYRLGEVCSRLKSGKGIMADSVLNTGEYPVIGGNGIRGYTNVSNFVGQAAVIGRQGANCGNVRFFEGEAYMTEHAIVAVGNEHADTRFLAFLLSLMHLGNLSAQSAQPGISVQTLSKQIVCLPSISYQKKISTLIKSIDDKIENNRKINENLEQQAQALFKSWFVDFEPFRDQPFVDSELGPIPQGWEICSLPQIANITSGYSYKGSELKASNVAMATIKNFDRNGYFKIDGFKEIIPSNKVKEEQYVQLFDIIVAHTDLTQKADIIGNAALILSFNNYDNIVISMDLCKVISTDCNISNPLLYCFLKNVRFKEYALGYTNGTTVLHLSKKALSTYSLIIPKDRQILSDINNTINKLFLKISTLINENIYLARLRDTLLPKLMSGEIKV